MEARANHHPETDRVNGYVDAATNAARRGDVREVELNLARLRLLAPARVDQISDWLYAIAHCVQAHPSYQSRARGGRATATG